MEYDDITCHILFSLHRKGYYGTKHTPVVYICKRLPQYSCKKVKHRIKRLIQNGLLTPYPTKHGLDVKINIHKAIVVKRIIKPLEDEFKLFDE